MQTTINNIPPTNLLAPPTTVPNRPSPVYLAPQTAGTQQGTAFAGQFVNAQSQAGQATLRSPVAPQINQTSQQKLVTGVAIGPQTQTQISQAVPPKPTSSSRIEYVPYDKKVIEYETRQIVSNVWVPVQRKCLNYYAIQHITQYMPREVDDVRYEMVPEEYVEYRLQYVPVEKQIVHFPNDQAHYYHDVNRQQIGEIHQGYYTQNVPITQNIGVSGVNTLNIPNQHLVTGTSAVNVPGYQAISAATQSINVAGYQSLPNRGLAKSNFVTSDGYVPSYYTPLSVQSHQQPSLLKEQQLASGIASNLRQMSREGSTGLGSRPNNLDSYYSPSKNWDRNAY